MKRRVDHEPVKPSPVLARVQANGQPAASARLMPAAQLTPARAAALKPAPLNNNILAFDGGRNHMVFASLKPASKGTLDQQWDDVCKQLNALVAAYGLSKANIVKQIVFLSGTEVKEPSREHLHRYHAGVGPATSFIFQPPVDGEDIAMEVLAIQGEQVKVEWVTPNLTIVSDSVCRWACVAGVEPQPGLADAYDQVLSCFRQMRRILEGAGFHFNQVVRTWLFERGIVDVEKGACGAERQRYQILNDARREFFLHGNDGKPYLFTHNLPPASTAIGMSAGSFVTECLALDVPRGALEVKPLNNPEQMDAHAYTAEVLERGAAAIKAAPLFCAPGRAR